ncbi:ABC transporter permease [Acidicapsa acidisoli]|uniref:ABC transporter permease n=1 Tax=Acidicapsa acidisoli TaxID=1615681 RepID=UPI0021DF8635|nr:ABC transporter permease [Acidicapsa acidisoli]
MLASLMQDIRYALRQLRKSPGFTFTAITVLALGLGANIAVFTLIDGILLRPLPYAQPGRIVAIQGPVNQGFEMELSYANLQQLSDAAGSTVQTGVVLDQKMASVVGPGGRFQVEKVDVTAGLTRMLGVQPMLGRSFRPDENDPGREHVVLLGEDVWRKLFGADPMIVGKTLAIKSHPYTIVGVMPKGFSFPFGEAMQVWSPAAINAAERAAMSGSHQRWGDLFARLPDGMTMAQLAANLNRAQTLIAKEVPEGGIPANVQVKDYQNSLNESARKPLGLLYTVVLGVWALACLNVTSLMLARAVSRTREQAVRAALGASKSRLLQQSIVESLLLSMMGSALGLLAGQVTLKLLWHQIKQSLPMTNHVHLEWRVVAGLGLLTIFTALLVGIFPALRATSANVQEQLHGVNSTASTSHNRTREALVVAQLALTLVFLSGAGLFLRTINALRQVPLGFTQQNVLTGGIILNPTAGGLEEKDTEGSINIVQTSYIPLLNKLRAIPGVQVAALSSVLPMRGEFMISLGATLDHKEVPQSQMPRADGRLASAGVTEALGIPMLRGRFFSEDDTATSPVVVVVNQAFVNRYMSGQDAIGHSVSISKGRFGDAHIVGVIGDVKQRNVTKATTPEMYFCLAQMTPGAPLYNLATAFMQVAIRARVPAEVLRARFDKALHEVAPDATTTDVKTIHEAVEDSFGSQTLTSYLLEGFAGLALLIASVGLYGLLAFAVAQRTREIGVRLALGAQKANILKLVLRRALLLVGAGLVCGMVMAWFAVSLARSYVYGVQVHDGLTFGTVTAVLAAASFLAAWMPARHAASIEPIVALRSE